MKTTSQEPQTGRPLRILHLEDNPEDHLLVKHHLHSGHPSAEIRMVDNANAFGQALERGNFDLILSDKNIPGFDGLEALRLARASYPNIPFVFVTGSMGEEAAIDTIKEGATDYVLKDRLNRLSLAVERAIRDYHQAEMMRLSEKHIRDQAALLDTAQDAIMVMDLEDRILYWNKSAERIFGYLAEEMMGTTQVIVHPRESAKYLEAKQNLIETGKWMGELVKMDKQGHELTVESRWTLVKDAYDLPQSIFIIDTDVTARRSLESQLLRAQRLECVGSLASGIAHDLNNCLSPILMGVAVLGDMVEDPSLKKVIAAMEASAMRGAGVVRQVLTFGRGASGERVVLQPNHLVSEMVKIIRETFPRNIEIKSECAPNLWAVSADPTQFHQVLLNMCVNARDAMPDGGKLTLTTGNVTLDEPVSLAGLTAPAGPFVRVDIKDSGTGIPPEIVEKIFQPFFTTKPEGKGTGLGLATTVRILAGHKGLIGVHSTPGGGTTFSLYFPASKASVEAEKKSAGPPPSGHQKLLLLVDDEAAIREMCKFLLESCGYRVLTAENGAQALAVFTQHKNELSLVVTDSIMPVMGGSTAAKAMRWAAPGLKIISTSGAPVAEADLNAADPKVHRYLSKPYTAESLLRVISEMLGNGHGTQPSLAPTADAPAGAG